MSFNSDVTNNPDPSTSFYSSSPPPQEKAPEIEPYSQLNSFKMLFSKSENIPLLFSIAKCWVGANVMRIQSEHQSDPELMQKAKIHFATGVVHRAHKILQTFAEMTYGEGNVLVTTRNIGNKEVLRSEEDRQAYIDMRNLISQKFQDKDLDSLFGYGEFYLSKKCKDNIDSFVPRSAASDGVCYSACMYLIGKLVEEPEINEQVLIRNVEELSKGVPSKVTAIQQVYEDLEFNNLPERITSGVPQDVKTRFYDNIVSTLYKRALNQGFNLSTQHLDEVKSIVINAGNALGEKGGGITPTFLFRILCLNNETQQNYISFNEAAYKNADPLLKSTIEAILNGIEFSEGAGVREKVIANLYGFKEDTDGTIETKKLLGANTDYPSSKEHLQNLRHLQPGFYEVSINTRDSGHSVLYVKTQQGQGYLIDPNYGLIKCDSQDHKQTFLKMLSLYPPPDNKKENENEDRNYLLRFFKYIKPVDLNNLSSIAYTDDFSINAENEQTQKKVEPEELINNFLVSIKTISNEAKVFVVVKTTDKIPQLIEYSHLDYKPPQQTMSGTRLDNKSVSIDVSTIQGLEIVPQLGDIVPSPDKEELKKIGITFNKDGFINVPKDKYTIEKTMKNNTITLKISDKKGEVVTIETAICADKNTCKVVWNA